jgi:hypothetical protein
MLVPRKLHRYIIRINVKVSVSTISKIVSFDLDYRFLVKYLSAAFHSRFTQYTQFLGAMNLHLGHQISSCFSIDWTTVVVII